MIFFSYNEYEWVWMIGKWCSDTYLTLLYTIILILHSRHSSYHFVQASSFKKCLRIKKVQHNNKKKYPSLHCFLEENQHYWWDKISKSTMQELDFISSCNISNCLYKTTTDKHIWYRLGIPGKVKLIKAKKKCDLIYQIPMIILMASY